MRKIKVLHITQATIGGTLEYIKLFFENIDKNKYELKLICPSYGPMYNEIKAMGFMVIVVDMKRQISFFSDIKSCIELYKYIKKYKPDIVHLHSSKAGVLGRIAAHFCNVPVIYNAHGWAFLMEVSSARRNIYAHIERFFSKYTNVIINVSENEQKAALKYKIAPKEKMVLINNGIDAERFNINISKKDILEELLVPEGSFVVGMVGRISKQKNYELFLEISERILKLYSNAFFIIVGDGECRDEIQLEIKEKGLQDRFLITGWVKDVQKYIKVFDVAVLTSKWEGFGLALAEYMASKKAIVASNVGGIPNVIRDNYNGILVESGDVDGFVSGIVKMKEDDKLREYFIRNSYEDVYKKFNITRVIIEHEELYNKLFGVGS